MEEIKDRIFRLKDEISYIPEEDVEVFIKENPDAVEVYELGFREWRDRLIEKLTMTKVNENNGVDSSEDDMKILKALHDHVWYPGAIVFFGEIRLAGSATMAEQGLLFCQNDINQQI